MANYCCAVRTNYFHVKDEEKFRELMNRVCGAEDSVDLWESTDKLGNKVFGFGLYSQLIGLRNSDDDYDADIDDNSYDEFIFGLQECVEDDDAIIIFESGNEKLRYVVGMATVITSQDCSYINMESLAIATASHMLNNSQWTTKCCY